MSEEILDIFNENNEYIGKCARSQVHKLGYIHRSFHIFIFNKAGEFLIQKRAPNKDLAPSHWDLSAAEHLKPDERFVDAAVRGVREELSIIIDESQMELVKKAHLTITDYPDQGIKDHEFNEAYKLIYDGEYKIDNDEVVEAKFVSIAELNKLLEQELLSNDQFRFTPWFHFEYKLLKDKLFM